MKKYLIILLCFTLHFVYSQDFEVAPVVLNFNADPGEIQQFKVTIRNHANIKQAFTFSLGDFEIDENGKKNRMAAGTSKRSCADWVTISPALVELNPNEEREVTVIMTVPKDKPSSKWSMIYVQSADEQDQRPVDKQLATGIKVVPRIVILVNQSPKSNTNYKAEINNLINVSQPTDSLQTFNVTVNNTGDKIIEANVQLAIANMQSATEQKFPKEMLRVYPGEKKTFTITISLYGMTPGQYALAAILDYGHGTRLEGTQILLNL